MTIVTFLLMCMFHSTIVVAVVYGLYLFTGSALSSYRRHYLMGAGMWFWNAIMTSVMWTVGFGNYPLLGLTLGCVIGTMSGSVVGYYIRSVKPKTTEGNRR